MCYNNDITKVIRNSNNGLVVCSSIVCGNINVADDIALISLRVSGLQSMINIMHEYSKKWRFTFNVSKTCTITFGESTAANRKNKEKRLWSLNNKPIEEKSACEHVGIILSSDFSSSTRTKEAVKKGNEAISALMSIGMRPGGLNPICGIELWKSIGLPKMLFGSELWWNLHKTDLEMLERVNRHAAKRSQGLCPTTRSEAATGNLGLWTIEGHIDKKKLLYLQKLISSDPTAVHKEIFIRRIFNFLNGTANSAKGYVPDILRILHKYDLRNILDTYLNTGQFPKKSNWKNVVKKQIHQFQLNIWRIGMLNKSELTTYSLVHNDLTVLELWIVAFRHPLHLKALANMANVLCGNVPVEVMSSVICTEIDYKCKHCLKNLNDISYHFIMDCPLTSTERTKLWDLLQDRIPIEVCAQLFNCDDETTYLSFLQVKLSIV